MKCLKCGAKVARFPLRDDEGNWIIKNFFMMDLMSIIWFAVLIILVISYKADIKTCEEITTNPLGYCEESNACKIIEERKTSELGYIVSDESIFDVDIG